MLIAGDLVYAGADLLLAGAVIGCVYLLISAVVIATFKRPVTETSAAPVPVTLLVPLCGHEPQLADRLMTLRRQDYPGPVQIICGLQSESDPALDTVKAVAAAPEEHPIEWHVDTRLHGRNMKVSNLINMEQQARHETLVMVDSDVEVETTLIAELVGALQQPGVGAVTSLYHGVPIGGVWARLASSRINTHFLPNVIFALSFGLARPCFGVGMALRRDTLRRIGGFESVVETLWEDYAIGEAVRAQGEAVVVAPAALGHVYAESSAKDLFVAELRAARTIKGLDPHGYAGSIITHPFALALVAGVLGAGSLAIWVMLTAFVCRMAVSYCTERRFGTTETSYLMLPLRELLSFAIYVASYFGSTVVWRGQRYRLSNRTLVADPG